MGYILWKIRDMKFLFGRKHNLKCWSCEVIQKRKDKEKSAILKNLEKCYSLRSTEIKY
jgi:hypothetical protein